MILVKAGEFVRGGKLDVDGRSLCQTVLMRLPTVDEGSIIKTYLIDKGNTHKLPGNDTAVSLIQDCFTRYHKLHQEARKVDLSSDFLEFGDTLDSLLHAGLVAQAQVDWQTALAFFTFFEKNERGYVAIRPLQEKVEAAKSAIQANLSPTTYADAVAQAQQKMLDELLAIWLA